MYGFSVSGPTVFDFPLTAKLVPGSLVSGSLFGSSVAVFEGSEISTPEAPSPVTVVCGAPGASDGEGSAFVYYATDASSPEWTNQGVLTPSDSSVTSFGQSVALFLDVLVSTVVKSTIEKV